MSELPSGWATAALGELAEDCRQRIPLPNEQFQYIDIASIDRQTKRIVSPQTLLGSKAPSRARKEVLTDDVLVSMTRPNLNAVAMVPATLDAQIASTGFDVLRSRSIEARWLFYIVRTRGFVEAMSNVVQGALYPAVRSKDVRGFAAPLAPLPEQTRIADKLDGLLARMDACRERLNRVPGILRRFRQSVLVAATSGELTREWREERSGTADTDSWLSTTLMDLGVASRVITYGVIKLGEETPRGVPCLRTSNVRWLRIDTEGMKRIAPALSTEYGRTILDGGEVLVNVRGTLGGVAVVEPQMRGWNVSREVAVVPVNQNRINSHFLAYWVASDNRQRWLSRVEKGVAYTGINIEDLRRLPVSVPPMEEQTEIVRRVQALLDAADEIERRHAAIAGMTVHLTPSILAMAFRGELVPQDPNDEPASTLLSKLKAAQAIAAAQPSRKRPATPGKRPKRGATKR